MGALRSRSIPTLSGNLSSTRRNEIAPYRGRQANKLARRRRRDAFAFKGTRLIPISLALAFSWAALDGAKGPLLISIGLAMSLTLRILYQQIQAESTEKRTEKGDITCIDKCEQQKMTRI
jgi:hypothetical protein